jgi:putative membrane protein
VNVLLSSPRITAAQRMSAITAPVLCAAVIVTCRHGPIAMALRQHIARCPEHFFLQAPRYPLAMKIILRWLLLAAALLLVAHLYPGVVVQSFGSAMLAAFVLGLLNTLLRPILVLLTLPVTLVTLGLFLFVINALMFYFAAEMLDGLQVAGFTAALIGSLIYSLCGMVIDVAMERIFASRAPD